MTWLLIQVHNLPVYLSIILSIASFSKLLFIPISGAWSSRVQLPDYIAQTVYLSCLMLVSLILSITMLLSTDYWILGLAIPTIVLGVSTALLEPLSMKVISSLFRGEEMIGRAYKAKYASTIINIVLGPTLSGFAIAAYGGHTSLVFAFLFCGLACLGIVIFKRTYHPTNRLESTHTVHNNWIHDILQGFKISFSIHEERIIAGMCMLLNFFFVPFIFLLLPNIVIQLYQYSMREVGLIELCFGAGAIVPSLDYFSVLLKRIISPYYTFLLSITAFAATFFVFSIVSTIIHMCLLGVVMGLSISLFNITVNTKRAQCIPSSHQTILEGCFLFLCSSVVPIGYIVTGILIDIWPLKTIIYVYSSVCFFSIAGLYASSSIKKMFREDSPIDYYFLQYPKTFT